MIAGIACTVVFAAIALYQALAARQYRVAADTYRAAMLEASALSEARRRHLADLGAAVARMQDAVIANDAGALLVAVQDATRAVCGERTVV